jgi:hypothetical protein
MLLSQITGLVAVIAGRRQGLPRAPVAWPLRVVVRAEDFRCLTLTAPTFGIEAKCTDPASGDH